MQRRVNNIWTSMSEEVKEKIASKIKTVVASNLKKYKIKLIGDWSTEIQEETDQEVLKYIEKIYIKERIEKIDKMLNGK